MTVVLPTPAQLRSVAEQCGLSLTDDDVASFRGLMQGSIEAYNVVAAMPDELPEVKYPRTPGTRPAPEDNKHNAWYRKSTVKGAASGKLKGKTVALKDNIMSLEERRVTGELLQPIKQHCSLVIVEHDLDFIRDICDRLTVLDQGRVLASGTVSEIQANKDVQEIYLRRA